MRVVEELSIADLLVEDAEDEPPNLRSKLVEGHHHHHVAEQLDGLGKIGVCLLHLFDLA